MKSLVREPLIFAALVFTLAIIPASLAEAWIKYGKSGGETLELSVQSGAIQIGTERVVETGLFPMGGAALGQGEWDIGSGATGTTAWNLARFLPLPNIESGVSDGLGVVNYDRMTIPLWFVAAVLGGIGFGARHLRHRSRSH